jgi:hypothetical protein
MDLFSKNLRNQLRTLQVCSNFVVIEYFPFIRAEVPQSMPPGSSLTIPLTTSVTTSATPQNISAISANLPTTSFSVPYYQLRTGYNYWPPSYGAGSTPYPYPYGGYYANVPANGTTQYASYLYSQQYRSESLQWQQPYQGPSLQQAVHGTSQAAGIVPSEGQVTTAPPSDSGGAGVPVISVSGPVSALVAALASPSTDSNSSSPNSEASTPSVPTPQDPATPPMPPAVTESRGDLTSSDSNNASTDPSQPGFQLSAEMEQAILRNLQALSMMQPTQLAEILQSNPQLQVVFGAINQAKPGTLS